MTSLRELLELRMAGEDLPPVDERDARRVHCPVCLDDGVIRVWHPKSVDAARKIVAEGGALDSLRVLYSAVAACTCQRGDVFYSRPTKDGTRIAMARYSETNHCRLDGQPSSAAEKAKLATWIENWRPANYTPSFDQFNESGYVNQEIDF